MLAHCSAHRETGESLPKEMFDKLDDSRHAGAALAMMRQIELGLYDFRLHTEYDPDGPRVNSAPKPQTPDISAGACRRRPAAKKG